MSTNNKKRHNFNRNFAIIIGINEYKTEENKLTLAVPDAKALANILGNEECKKYCNGDEWYEVLLLTDETEEKPTYEVIKKLLDNLKQGTIDFPGQPITLQKDDRLLFYFSGHGKDIEGTSEGLKLISQDEKELDDQELIDALRKVPCDHILLILDCCYSGKVKKSVPQQQPTYKAITIDDGRKTYRQDYDRMWKKPAFIVITSAGNTPALDSNNKQQTNSYFLTALQKALKNEGTKRQSDTNNDNIITAVEIFNYLASDDNILEHQQPKFLDIDRREKGTFRGQYFFLHPEFNPDNLTKIEELDSPYKGLFAYEEKDEPIFCGQEDSVNELFQIVNNNNNNNNRLTVVTGASGSGKSSIVKAGLIPRLKKHEKDKEWLILEVIHPGKSPLSALAQAILPFIVSEELIDEIGKLNFPSITKWENYTLDKKLSLILDSKLKEKIKNQDKEKESQEKEQLNQIEAKVRQKLNQVIKTLQAGSEVKDYSTIIESINNKEKFSKSHNKVLLIVDQFEELITQSEEKEKTLFFDFLVQMLKECEKLHILVTVRSDFEIYFRGSANNSNSGKNQNDAALGNYWHERLVIKEMDNYQLRKAIITPAYRFTDIDFESEKLISKIINEVFGMPGALALLSFTLDELYKKAKKSSENNEIMITEKHYEELGGVVNALTNKATEVYEELGKKSEKEAEKEEGQSAGKIRQAMMIQLIHRMITTQGGKLAKRPVPKSELVYPQWRSRYEDATTYMEEVTQKLVDARLIVSGSYSETKGDNKAKPYFEPAHDALILHWDKLNKDQDLIALNDRLISAVQDWEQKQQEPPHPEQHERWRRPINALGKSLNFALEQGLRLEPQKRIGKFIKGLSPSSNVETSGGYLWKNDPRLEQVRQFLYRKDSWLNKSETEFVQQSVIQKGRGNLVFSTFLMIVTLGGVFLTVWALNEQRNTLIEQVRTSRQSAEANLQANRDLEALTDILRARKTFDNWLLKVGNSELEKTQVRGTLFKAIYATKERNRLQLDRAVINSVALHPTKDLLAIAGNRGTIRLFNSAGKPMGSFPTDHDVSTLAFTPDGNWLTTGGDKKIKLWKVENGNINTSISKEIKANEGVIDIAFNPNNNHNRMATVTDDYKVQLWSFEKPKNEKETPNFRFEAANFPPKEEITPEQQLYKVAFRPTTNQDQQDQLVTVGISDEIKLWNITNNKFLELKRINTDQKNVHSIAFNKDDNLATGGENETIKFWKIEGKSDIKPLNSFLTGKQQEFKTQEQTKIIYGMAFGAPDKLAIFGEDDEVTLLNNSGNIDKKIQPQDTYVNDAIAGNMAYSPDGKQVAVIAGGNTIRLWNLKSGKQERRIVFSTEEYGNAISLAFSPSGTEFAVGTEKGYITLWNTSGESLDEARPQWKENEPYHPIQRIIFHPNETRLAVLGNNGDLGYLSFQKEDSKQKLKIKLNSDFKPVNTNLGDIKDLVFDSKFQQFFTIDKQASKKVKLWESTNAKVGQEVNTQANSVAFSPNNTFFATAGEDGKVKLWKFNNLKTPSLEFDTHQKNIQSIVFDPKNSNSLLTGGEDGTVRLWHTSGNKPTQLLVDRQKPDLVALSSEHKLMATLKNNNQLLMWERGEKDRFTPKNISETNLAKGNYKYNYKYISFMPNSNRLLTVDGDSNVKLWDSEGQKFVQLNENEPKQQVSWVTWNKDGNVLATVNVKTIKKEEKKIDIETVKLWDFQDDKFQQRNIAPSELEEFQQRNIAPSELEEFQQKQEITSIALSADGERLATTELEHPGRIKLWDTLKGNKIGEFQTQQGKINSIAFSPDRKRLATVGGVSKKRTLRLWDVLGNPLGLIQENNIDRARFSPDGRLLAGVRNVDNQLMVWDVSGDKFNPLYGQKLEQKFGVKAFEFTTNGQLIALGQEDRKVSQWQIDEKYLLAQACGLVKEYLESNPNVAESDKNLCEDVDVQSIKLEDNDEPVAEQIPNSVPSPTPIKPLQAITGDFYNRGQEQASENLIRKKPNNIDDYINRGIAYYRLRNKYPDKDYIGFAIKDYTTALGMSPKKSQSIQAYVNRGIAYSTKSKPGDQEEAIADYTKVINNIDSKYVDAYISRGIAYSALPEPKHDEAIKNYEKAISINDNDANAYYALAFTLALQQQNKQEAIQAYQKAADLYKQQNKPNYAENARKKIEELSVSKSP